MGQNHPPSRGRGSAHFSNLETRDPVDKQMTSLCPDLLKYLQWLPSADHGHLPHSFCASAKCLSTEMNNPLQITWENVLSLRENGPTSFLPFSPIPPHLLIIILLSRGKVGLILLSLDWPPQNTRLEMKVCLLEFYFLLCVHLTWMS